MTLPGGTFVEITRGGVSWLVFEPWWERGIRHGFSMRPFDERDAGAAHPLLREVWGAPNLFLLRQVHGSHIVEVGAGAEASWRAGTPEGDSVLAPAPLPGGLIGVKSADCVPLLFVSGSARAAVHAGWRGLCSPIIAETVRLLGERSGGAPLECVIGPCAGVARYEIGPEVAALLPPCARSEKRGDSLYLDLAGTAAALVRGAAGEGVMIASSNRCTMTDSRFHSWRRDGSRAGRNLAFFAV